MNKNLSHADAIMAAKGGTILIVSEPVNVTNMSAGGVLLLPMGRTVRVNCSTGSTLFAIDAETLDNIAFGMKEALSFDCVRYSKRHHPTGEQQ
jgi:hypothetical protein